MFFGQLYSCSLICSCGFYAVAFRVPENGFCGSATPFILAADKKDVHKLLNCLILTLGEVKNHQ
jgi:hypothetical protein